MASEANLRGEAAELLATGTVPVQTISEVIHRYRLRPEHKSLAPNGQPAARDTVGALKRRPVKSTLTLQTLSGKEGNKLLERLSGEVNDSDEYRVDYGARKQAWPLVVAAVRALGPGAIARQSGLDRRTIQRAIRQDRPATTPHRGNQARIAAAAASLAKDRLRGRGEAELNGTLAPLVRFLELHTGDLP